MWDRVSHVGGCVLCAISLFEVAPATHIVPRMTTLPEVRTKVREDLRDSEAERWPDDQIDRHIAHALSDLSLAIPRELTAQVPTTAGSRDLAVGSLELLIEVEAVEFPVGNFPAAFVSFSSWGGTLSLHSSQLPDGSDAKVYYLATHTLDDEGSTLGEHLVDVLTTGASAYAALELASFTTDRLNLDPRAAERHLAWARARLTAFQQLLHTYGRKNRVRERRLFVPA